MVPMNRFSLTTQIFHRAISCGVLYCSSICMFVRSLGAVDRLRFCAVKAFCRRLRRGDPV